MLKYRWGKKHDDGQSECSMTWVDRRNDSTVTFNIRADQLAGEDPSHTDTRLRGEALRLAKAFLADQDPASEK
jgi:hypothetical protein